MNQLNDLTSRELASLERVCKKCKKLFIVSCAELWTYKIRTSKGFLYYCCYRCWVEDCKKIEAIKRANEEAYWLRKQLRKKEANKKRRENKKHGLSQDV